MPEITKEKEINGVRFVKENGYIFFQHHDGAGMLFYDQDILNRVWQGIQNEDVRILYDIPANEQYFYPIPTPEVYYPDSSWIQVLGWRILIGITIIIIFCLLVWKQ